MEIEMADSDKSEDLKEFVNQVLLAIAPYMTDGEDLQAWVDYCWVSDESDIGDFQLGNTALIKMSEQFGFTVQHSDRVWQVAEKLRDMSKHRM